MSNTEARQIAERYRKAKEYAEWVVSTPLGGHESSEVCEEFLALEARCDGQTEALKKIEIMGTTQFDDVQPDGVLIGERLTPEAEIARAALTDDGGRG